MPELSFLYSPDDRIRVSADWPVTDAAEWEIEEAIRQRFDESGPFLSRWELRLSTGTRSGLFLRAVPFNRGSPHDIPMPQLVADSGYVRTLVESITFHQRRAQQHTDEAKKLHDLIRGYEGYERQ